MLMVVQHFLFPFSLPGQQGSQSGSDPTETSQQLLGRDETRRHGEGVCGGALQLGGGPRDL